MRNVSTISFTLLAVVVVVRVVMDAWRCNGIDIFRPPPAQVPAGVLFFGSAPAGPLPSLKKRSARCFP